ncbi:MAG: methyl-accepting chemotaxis protein [Bacillota bacterium]
MIANLKIRAKLATLIIIGLLSTLGVGLVSAGSMQTLQANLKRIEDQRIAQIMAINDAQAALERMRQGVYKYVISTSDNRDAAWKQINNEQQNIGMALMSYAGVSDDQQETEKINELKATLQAYYVERDQVLLLIDRGENSSALDRIGTELSDKEGAIAHRMQARVTANKQLIADAVAQSGKAASAARTTIFIGLVGCMLLAGGFGWLVMQDIVSRLKRLQVMAERLAAGDLTVDDHPVGSDEIHAVTVSLNAAIENIHQMTKSISHAVVTLNRFTGGLVTTANETGEGAAQVAATIEHLAQGAQDQSGVVGEMVTSINQVGQLAADADRSLAQAVAMSHDMIKITTEGQSATQEAVNQMSRIMTASQGVTETVTSLTEVSAEIGDVVEMISDISGQITFLALNASIEAARAGQYGRGFAVVADEVSKLADQTQASTERISALVADIGQHMNEATAKAEQAHRETKMGVNTIEKTGQAFGQINASVEQLARALTSVAENSSRVAENAVQLEGLAGRVNDTVEESSAATEQVSATAQQQAASTQQLVAAASELSGVAEQLEELVGQFRLTDSPLVAARQRRETGRKSSDKSSLDDLIDASGGITVE